MPDASRTERIWIIGASDGIGAALARGYHARGASLTLSARSENKLNELNDNLDSKHQVVTLDVSNRESLKAATDKVAESGLVDRIVHLAALYDPGKVLDLDPDMAAKIISVNLTGCFNLAQIAPKALKPMGQLAITGSVAGYIGLPQGQIYSATKAGVINLVESLRAELSGQVDVRLISPGFVDTRLTQQNNFEMPAVIEPDEAARRIISGLDRKRFEIHFPRRLTLTMKLLRLLPYWASMPLTRRLVQ
ncbi:SDR family NAD(P)-dependent oxidoreductase [Celeribacter litoreus]|uniref:SDR family NAD(P)-dependent oxidoreductase n=1 Tax=Celeribacter litoreus TaxID=2876714 RepID=UPI001CCC631A|nr:SDR family NAD(P)-dependent oxidoreductase [Celeribacter litoreus]MCA0043185.1 SDR family NAD(P)-dependent oxidoreductase [Celeribacter litoreus]